MGGPVSSAISSAVAAPSLRSKRNGRTLSSTCWGPRRPRPCSLASRPWWSSASCRVRPEPRNACVRLAWGCTPRANGGVPGGNGDPHEVNCLRNYDHRTPHVSTRVRAIRNGHGLDARCWRNEGQHVERSDAGEKARGKPQAKETHGELQAAAQCQSRELQNANDGVRHLICTGSEHQCDTEVAIAVMSARATAAS